MQAADSPTPHERACAPGPLARRSPELRPALVRPRRRWPVRRGGRRPGAVAPPSGRRRTLRALASEVGQGTVEYVGLLLLMATVLAAVVAAAGNLGGDEKIGKKVVTQIGESIDKAGGSR